MGELWIFSQLVALGPERQGYWSADIQRTMTRGIADLNKNGALLRFDRIQPDGPMHMGLDIQFVLVDAGMGGTATAQYEQAGGQDEV